MEMQNVIGEQYIVRRRKPVRIILDTGLIRPATNGRIDRGWAKVARHRERGREPALKAALAPKPYSAEVPAKRASPIGRNARLGARLAAFLGRFFAALSSPKMVLPVVAAFSVALLSVAVAVVGSMEKRADLGGFVLPDDGAATSMLLDAVSMEPRAINEGTAMPDLPVTVTLTSYKVTKNDTLDGISRRFGLRLDTLISLNGIRDARKIASGTSLKIPSIDGIAYTVKKGESLSTIAASRGVSILDLIDANDLASQTIVPGQSLFVPGARLSSYDLKKALGKLVAWPTSGRISSNFGYRPNPFTGIRQFHNGLDIVGPENSPAKAAMDGRVAETGYSAVFGNFVILTHAEGYQTLYAHLNKIKVKQGSSVQQGVSVGLIGSTGYSTGPHLHFGVFKNGVAIDPLKLLQGR